MHRVINNTPEGFETDHRDGDGLNNRRANLRTATRAQNEWNTGMRKTNSSGFKGVHFHKPSGKWRACIRHNGTFRRLGQFRTAEDAAARYYAAAMLLRGRHWHRD